jgi:P2-related tail formation protein
MGYQVSVTDNGFYIHNEKGTIVADLLTVDGIRGFAQAIEWSDHENTTT